MFLTQKALRISVRFAAKHHAFALIGIVVLVAGVGAALAQVPTSQKPVTKTVPVATHTKPTAATAAPKTTAAPAPPPATKPVTKTVATSTPATKPAPAIKTSPQSEVSNLTPTTPAQSSSSSSSSGDSSGSSGSSSSGSSSSPTLPPATGGYQSTNWSGYLAATSSYTAVSGSWTVDTVTGNGSSTSADAEWIGIGGVLDQDLIQIGTSNIVSASGHVTTSAFYELLPAVSTTITTLPVNPGDSMSASIIQTSTGVWTMTITDNTSGQSYNKQVSYSSSLSSAEWIEEEPSYANGNLIPLTPFSGVSFTHCQATASAGSQTLSQLFAQPITLVSSSGHTALATPSVLASNGTDFNVAYNGN